MDKARDKVQNPERETVRTTAKHVFAPKLKKVERVSDLKSYALTTLFYGSMAWASWQFIINPAWEKYQLNKANKKVVSDPQVQLASLLRQAIIGAGTNVTMVMDVARKITDWNAVQEAYRQLTKGNNLNEDLYGDLTSRQYQRFMDIVNHKLKTDKAESKRGYIVVSSKDVRLRSSPDSSRQSWWFNSNVLNTVPRACLLGFATGKYQLDAQGVLFYEVRIKYLNGIPAYHKETAKELKQKQILTYWVGAGAISMFRDFTQLRQAYPEMKLYKGTKDTGLRQALKK